MGCGVSKIDPEEVGGPARGFKRLPRRYPAAADHSTTFLPKRAAQVEDADESLDHSLDRESVSSTAMGGSVGKAAGAGGGGCVCSGDHTVMKGDNDEDMREGGIVREKDSDYNDLVRVRDISDWEEERRSIPGRDDSITCPGSPSFREYCVYNASRNGRNGRPRSSAKVENRSQREESLHYKKQGQKTKVTKKISQEESRRSGRVRNLLTNVACYNPSSRSIPHGDL
ncbi:hypothetical protein ACOSQ3_002062 [Xanthoceras sorbifolium]